MLVGVLALQGDFREHLITLASLGIDAIPVRREDELARVDALILPGGESTTIAKLARTFGIFDSLRARIRGGMPVFGSCAGLILLSERILDGIEGQETFGGLNITTRRNAFGRQVDSFEGEIEFNGIGTLNGVFIRAPWVEEVGEGVEVLATSHGHPVAIRSGKILATSFHPEISGDSTVHKYFVDNICRS